MPTATGSKSGRWPPGVTARVIAGVVLPQQEAAQAAQGAAEEGEAEDDRQRFLERHVASDSLREGREALVRPRGRN